MYISIIMSGGESETLTATCSTSPGVTVAPADLLCIRYRKRLQHTYTENDGVRELRIFYGAKEVSFDDERMFPFGARLLEQGAFLAGSAASWGPDYDWDEIKPLLETLLSEGILHRGEVAPDLRSSGTVPGKLPPSACREARSWSAATCEELTRTLTGHAVEIGYLEAVVPAYRIAHPALDGDGRQVGEANVFPAALRLDLPTDWRTCQYSGSRYRDDNPMNVTALQAMIKHWKPMMATMLRMREAIRARLPRSNEGWTTGDLHTFARVVLSLPAYSLMLRGGSAAPPPLHPVISSLFRITDGIQLTTHDLLFLSAEKTRSPRARITARELFEFAEHNAMFLSDVGVCAGPKALIEELLAVVFEGTEVHTSAQPELAPEVAELLRQLPEAIDYALLSLQTWALSRSVWVEMARAHQSLLEPLQAAPDCPGPARALLEALVDTWPELERERLASEDERLVHDEVYADTYDQARAGGRVAFGPPSLVALIESARRPDPVCTERLRDAFEGGPAALAPSLAQALAEPLASYLNVERALVGAVAEVQSAINGLLERPAPLRELTVRDFRAMFMLNPPPISGFPYLLETLERTLGIELCATAREISVGRRAA